MEESNQSSVVSSDRRRRVNKLKKIIIIIVAICIIIPIILCIVMMFKIATLQKTVDELVALKTSGAIVATKDEQGKVHYVYAGEIKDKDPVDDSNSQGVEGDVNASGEVIQQGEQSGSEQDDVVDTGKYVYLTFDDGPSFQTNYILDILNEHNVTATFFVIGRDDEESKEIYKAIVDNGNSIGLHSYSHDYAYVYESEANFLADLTKISDLVYEATGVRSNLYRFPGGSSNSIVDDISMFKDCLAENGYTYFDWNSSSKDAATIMPTAEEIVNTVIAEVEGKDEVVVLMHDSERKESTVEALPILIEKLKAMGYTIKGIDENTTPVQHR